MNQPMKKVTVVHIPDNKSAVYIGDELIHEERYLTSSDLLRMLTENGVIDSQTISGSKDCVNKYGQFPHTLSEMKHMQEAAYGTLPQR